MKIIYSILFIGVLILSSCSGKDDSILIIPKTAVFFGNSLLTGFGEYGMAASESDKDYYHLITTYVTTLNSSFKAKRYSGKTFESLTNSANIDATIQSVFIDNLNGNEDLVVIQLGDNVNTPEKNAVFAVSSLKLCLAVRKKCPNARVVWIGLWFGSKEKYRAIQDACSKTHCTFISFSDLTSTATKNQIGNLTKKCEGYRTLDNVTNVVVNTASNITVTFSVGSKTYNTTLEVSSHSLNSGTLAYSSEYEIISDPGVASHPNDNGFRLIANRFLYKMKLTTTDEYYK